MRWCKQALRRRPLHSLNPALEELNLAPQRQDLGPETGPIGAAGRNQDDHDANQRIDKPLCVRAIAAA